MLLILYSPKAEYFSHYDMVHLKMADICFIAIINRLRTVYLVRYFHRIISSNGALRDVFRTFYLTSKAGRGDGRGKNEIGVWRNGDMWMGKPKDS